MFTNKINKKNVYRYINECTNIELMRIVVEAMEFAALPLTSNDEMQIIVSKLSTIGSVQSTAIGYVDDGRLDEAINLMSDFSLDEDGQEVLDNISKVTGLRNNPNEEEDNCPCPGCVRRRAMESSSVKTKTKVTSVGLNNLDEMPKEVRDMLRAALDKLDGGKKQ